MIHDINTIYFSIIGGRTVTTKEMHQPQRTKTQPNMVLASLSSGSLGRFVVFLYIFFSKAFLDLLKFKTVIFKNFSNDAKSSNKAGTKLWRPI